MTVHANASFCSAPQDVSSGSSEDTPRKVVDMDALFLERREERERLVQVCIEREGVSDPRVLAAMRRVPRHRFVPSALQKDAYGDYPLPIGFGQTVSQPFIVAYMTERLRVSECDRCLEIGTGSGYQAAVLCELGAVVYSVELIPELAAYARENLERLGYSARLRVGDGGAGWKEAAPFNEIIVTAAPDHVPYQLLVQLAVGGRLIVPVGPQYRAQALELWTRTGEGEGPNSFRCESLIWVQFVPFVGKTT